MKVAAIQMNSSADVADNLATAKRLIADAAKQGAQLALLPEYFCLMGHSDAERVAIGEVFGAGPIQRAMSEAAKQHGIWLIAGTIPLQSPHANKVFNSQLLFAPSGECVGRYDKVHLFSFDNGTESYREADILSPGSEVVTFTLPGLKVRPSVCYDLRFPEFYRANPGYELITAPAAFTYTTGLAHWELLLRCRALENQCYLMAAAQTGRHANGSQTFGHSMIINPWGEVLACLEQGEGVVLADVEPEVLTRIRTQLPALDNRCLF